MELQDFLERLRSDLDDDRVPYLYPDEELTGYLNNAVREACLRARLLKDDAHTNPELCTIQVDADESIVTFDESILCIRSAIIEGQQNKVWAVTSESMDKLAPGWDNGDPATGMPEYMVVDLSQKSFFLYPTPAEDITLRLRVWRVPAVDEQMVEDADEPAIAIPDDEQLLHWALHEAYLKKDSELYDPKRSADHETLFTARFGRRPSLHEMARWADSPGSVGRAHFL